MKLTFSVIIFFWLSFPSFAQKLSFRLDSSSVLTYKKINRPQLMLSECDSFIVARNYFEGGLLIDKYYYNSDIPTKIDTILVLNDICFLKKQNTWQTFFNPRFFFTNKKWQIHNDVSCFLYTPVKINRLKSKKIFVFHEEYCEDLGNNLDTQYNFELGTGIVEFSTKNGITFKLIEIKKESLK